MNSTRPHTVSSQAGAMRYIVGGALATALLVLALALLAWSFAVDVRWLYHTRPQS